MKSIIRGSDAKIIHHTDNENKVSRMRIGLLASRNHTLYRQYFEDNLNRCILASILPLQIATIQTIVYTKHTSNIHHTHYKSTYNTPNNNTYR